MLCPGRNSYPSDIGRRNKTTLSCLLRSRQQNKTKPQKSSQNNLKWLKYMVQIYLNSQSTMLGIFFSFAANLHNMRILWKFRKTKQEKQNQVYVYTQRSCKKTMKIKKQTNNSRETVAYLKRNNYISLRKDNKKVLKQVCEVQHSTANCSPTWSVCCMPCRVVTIKRLKVSSHVRYETIKIPEKLLTEVYNGTTTLEHNSMISYTVKHSFNWGVKKSPCHALGESTRQFRP